MNSVCISLEKIQLATAEHSTIWSFSILSISTQIICWWLCQSEKRFRRTQIWASSDSASVWNMSKVIIWLCTSEAEPERIPVSLRIIGVYYVLQEQTDTYLEHVVKLADGGEGVREALGAQVEQSLHEHVDLEGVEATLAVRVHVLARVGQVLQHVQDLLGGALLANRHHHLVSRRGAGQGGWKQNNRVTSSAVSQREGRQQC